MFKVTFNGSKITSQSQLKREIEKSFRAEIDRQIRSAAPPGVKVSKTRAGYVAEGSERDVGRMVKRLGCK